MTKVHFRYPLVPIRPVPSERLACAAPVNNIPPRVVVVAVGNLTRLGVNLRTQKDRHADTAQRHRVHSLPMQRKPTETRLYRQEMNERILGSGFKPFQRFFALDASAYTDGAIPVKYKEMMGLVASMVLRCNDCIFYHLDRCVQEGATREELHEAMNIALVIGGSIVIPHLRYAYEMMDALFAEKEKIG
jgi:AhpD family alkylhydroperoxidase